MEFNFRGKKALVTGGGSGLGRECAILFAKNGADVLVADLIPERCEEVATEIIKYGVNAISYQVDVTDYEQVASMYKKIVDEWGTVDIVVNSAGVCLTGELTEESLENIDKTIDINIKGRDSLKVADALRIINGVRNEIEKEKDDDENVKCGQKI